MAVHFSDEEKEKLKQDKASIYEDHTDEAIKEEIKNLSWKGKLKQFQHYYLKGVIIAVVIIAMIGLQSLSNNMPQRLPAPHHTLQKIPQHSQRQPIPMSVLKSEYL